MGMSIIESLSIGKLGNPELSEDLFVFTADFVAVVDGATNITGKKLNNKTPGRLIAEIVKSTIETLPSDTTLQNMVAIINRHLQETYKELGILEEIEEHAWMAPTASLIVYSRFYHEVWQIGDCQCIVDGRLYMNEKKIDEITANARSLFLEAEIKKGKTIDELLLDDPGWEFIQELIQQQYYLQNDRENQYGFEIINGFPVDFSKVRVIKVPDDAGYIVLASDGYPFLKNSLEESEAILQSVLKQDPLCFRTFKSAKGLKKGQQSFDDRTYLKFTGTWGRHLDLITER
ncbi:hypothetical protein [Neobacillus vireti]|uniref:PPM-type phosphatase domain-containing protein n=1 Tax=Neobacillus vireti LMG 21834 TaxID=1131730 RepID=A0AB94ISS0_9BACI|nr:hypothetical protein [Neobacillus vireti]ETI70150.1 hypothetical protein BAVI_03654 [Neobacillus vireti LMG 21834]